MKTLLIALACLLVCEKSSAELSAKEIAKKAFPSFVTIATFDQIQSPIAIGSGFFISPQNIVTNFHVIKGATYINARLSEGSSTFHITGLVAVDEKRDLAILRTDKANGSNLVWGDSDTIAVGEKIYALGNPEGLEGTFSEGIVSSLRKKEHLLQITAPISHGSSGGPIFSTSGEVIGVAVAFIGSGQNLNFAIPINELKVLVAEGSDKVRKPVDVPKVKESQSVPIKVSNDLTVTDHWFFIGFKNEQSKSSYVKSDAKSIQQGQHFGVRAVFKTSKDKIHTKLVLSVPDKAENFRFRSSTSKVQFSADHKTVTVDDEVPGSKGSVGYFWGTDTKDPLGSYSLKLFVEDKLVESKDFTVDSILAAPKVVVPEAKEQKEDQISIETIRANAGVCPSAAFEDNAYSYMKAFAAMLTYVSMGRDEYQKALNGKPEAILMQFDKSNKFFTCGMLQVAEYRSSKDSNLSMSADATVQSLNQLYAVNNLMREHFKKALNNEAMGAGDTAELIATSSSASDDAWKKLLPEGLIITHSMVDPKREGTLTITKKQKAELISALEKAVKKGYKKDNRALEVTVKYLVEFFNKGWKFQ